MDDIVLSQSRALAAYPEDEKKFDAFVASMMQERDGDDIRDILRDVRNEIRIRADKGESWAVTVVKCSIDTI
jgi:hypothetical protein